MSEPIKLPVFIAVVVAAVVIFGLIGYKFIVASNPPPRPIDANMKAMQDGMARAQAEKRAGGKVVMAPQVKSTP